MKKRLLCLILGACTISQCHAQRGWVIPKLTELEGRDAIMTGAANLSATETAMLKNVTKKEINGCVSDPGPNDPTTSEGNFKNFRVRRVSLSPQGAKGLVMQGWGACMCGATGNCPIWVLGDQAQPRVLLKAKGAQTFAFQETDDAGYFELVLGSHNSAMVTDLKKFHFDGDKYIRVGCASIAWADDIGNTLDPPRITPSRCF